MRWLEITEEKLTEATMYFGGFSEAPSRDMTNMYMRGWCPYFALALHDLLGYQMISNGEHFAVQHGDQFIDIRGFMNQNEFLDGLHGSFHPVSRNDVMNELESGAFKCGFFSESDLKKAIRVAKRLLK